MTVIPTRLAALAAVAGSLIALPTTAGATPTAAPADATPTLAAASAAPHGTIATSVVGGPAASATASDRTAARVASGWLGRRFVAGTHLTTDYAGTEYDDPGLTLDAVIAFAATKTNDTRAGRALTWLSDPAQLTFYAGDGTTESYAGAHAKLVLALQVRAEDPRTFGGRDILGELAALQRKDGRLSDRSRWGDFSNAFGQSLGVVALQRAGLPGGTRAAAYLAGQACPDGGVPILFEQPRCVADLDATALAIQAFRAAGRTAAAKAAATWFVASGAVANSNTAGLAAAGLDLVGGRANARAADAARAFIRARQQACTTPFTRRGAIALDTSGYAASTAPRATTQAVLGLTSTDLATLTSAGSIAWAPPARC